MKKKILSVLCAALILLLTLQLPVKALQADPKTDAGNSSYDVYDKGGYLAVGDKDEVQSLYDTLFLNVGTKFVFLTTEKDLPTDENIPTDFPFLTDYLEDDTPCVMFLISDLTNTATVRAHKVSLSEEELGSLLDTMITSLNAGEFLNAACKPALQAAEMIDSSFDPVEYRDWLLGSTGTPNPYSDTNSSKSEDAHLGYHIYDQENLLSKEDAERLEQLFKEKSEEIGVDIVFYTSSWFSDEGDEAATYLGGVCREKGYGYGDERYVVMFGISTGNRYAMAYEWSDNIRQYHRYLQVELDDIFDSVKSYLSTGMDMRFANRERSESAFADAAEKFLDLAVKHSDQDDAPYEAFDYSDNYERYDLDGHRKTNWGRFGLFGLIGAAISGIITGFTAAKHKPKTVTDPEVYSNRNQFAILESSDNFRVRTTTRVRMSSSSGGGGGHSHGGGHGGGGHGSGGHF